jgi:putative glutathione S-transferase
MGICGPVHDERSWTFDLDPGEVDPVLGIPRLRDASTNRYPDYPKGITVPAIAEIETVKVVTNDYRQMTLDFSTEWTEHHRDGAPDLFPHAKRDEILEVSGLVYDDVNNGVYKAGFAGSQGTTSGPTPSCSSASIGSRSGSSGSAT